MPFTSNNSMVSLPSPPLQWLIKHLENSGILSLPSERTVRDYKHFAPIMVRGLFTSLKFTYAQFQLFSLLYQCMTCLVVSVTYDGARDNNRMFSLHGTRVTYKTANIETTSVSNPYHHIKPLEIALQGTTLGEM